MTSTPSPAAEHPGPSRDPYDFSVVLGGPLFQLASRAHLCGDALELLNRRIIVITLFAWLPLLILSILDGHAWGSSVNVPFLKDIEVHVRLLLALPLLIVAELVVHQRMRATGRQFLERGLIADSSRTRFDAAVGAALRLRNSVVAEVVLLAFVYFVGVFFIWPRFVALNVATWYAEPAGAAGRHLQIAGWWYAFVSLPIFQFMLFRWYFRVFIWIRFLWQVSRCELRLVPTHPDRAGGLGFLALIVVSLAPLLMAHGALLAGTIANRIFFQGAKLPDFKVELVALPVILLLIVLGPLLLFSPHISQARRVGLREYGLLAQQYVRAFEDKWLRGSPPSGEPLIGSADIQSLADLANSYGIIDKMRILLFGPRVAIAIVAAALAPMIPVALLGVPLPELLGKIAGAFLGKPG